MAEIPQPVARQWAAQFRRQPQLSVDDAARLVLTLNNEQLKQFDLAMREQGIWVGSAFRHFITSTELERGHREMLRAYGSLTPGQRQALSRGAALPYEAFSPTARRWVRRALRNQQLHSIRQSDPFAPERAELSMAAQLVERTVKPNAEGFQLFYQPPGTPIDFDAQNASRLEDMFYRGFIPKAPGLVPPTNGQALEVTFRLRSRSLPDATCLTLFPYVGQRALEGLSNSHRDERLP